MAARRIVVLGPQRVDPDLCAVLDSLELDPRRPVAAITAGWEEREPMDQELCAHVGRRVLNLELFRRVEGIFSQDPELFDGMTRRHDRLRKLQELYRLRLDHATQAARALFARGDVDGDLLEGERASAIDALRALDTHHLERLRRIHADFEAEMRPAERDHVAHHRAEIARLVSESSCVLVAGGHVAILLNRLRLLGLRELLKRKTLVAWSAGAMALSERVVVHHDSPPQGPGNAEVFELGLGLLKSLVPLPHASERLRLDDAARVELFSRRFGPAHCVALDPGARLDWDARGRAWRPYPGTRRLTPAGLEEAVAG